MDGEKIQKDKEPRVADVGTIAGRAPAPMPQNDNSAPASPGAAQDRAQAEEDKQKIAGNT
jgi:hypothetical protein